MAKKANRVNVKRFIQDPSHCAVAAISTVCNFYNKSIDYNFVKKEAYIYDKSIKKEGMYTFDIGILLNKLGFKNCTIITTDLDIFDYEWARYSKKSLYNKLNKRARSTRGYISEMSKGFANFLNYSPRNKLIIDYNFGEYIRYYLDTNRPLILSYNWTMFHKWEGTMSTGEEHHAVVCHGYDKDYAYITDSHIKYYTYRLSKYRNGQYKIRWENLMTVMGVGDVILPGRFSST